MCLELFSGCEILSKALRRAGFAVISFDITRHWSEDLLLPAVQSLVKGWTTSGCVLAIWLGTPCTTWSIARRTGWGATALRSARHPMGVPGLDAFNAAKLQIGNATYAFTCAVIRLCIQQQVPCVLENPLTSRMWSAPALSKLTKVAVCSQIRLDQCQFGAAWENRSTN